MSKPVCVVVGVGPGNGAAFARRFDKAGYAVALLSRSTEFSKKLAEELSEARVFACDVTDRAAVESAFADIKAQLGPVEVLLYNAGSGMWGSVEEVDYDGFERAWRVNCFGALVCARQVIDDMKAAGKGSIIFTGATASLRGGAKFAAFASAKAAQRNLAQSMARHLGPSGIHVALVVVDGVIDLPRTRDMMPNKSDEEFLSPDAIADTVYLLCTQHASAWTHELDLRPYTEKW